MDRAIFEEFRKIIHRESGIWFSDQKVPLLSSRIMKHLRALGLKSEGEYLEIIQLDVSGQELTRLLDVISTNTTHFYREGEHFKVLAELFKGYREKNVRRLRVWSSACSSGEEPYTMAMLAREYLELGKVDLKILATDICSDVLQRAVDGVYQERQLRELPEEFRRKYFHEIGTDQWSVEPELRALITFKKHNMVKFPWPMKGPFNIIFCRNVMIYFNRDLRDELAKTFFKLLEPGGYFFVSHSETLSGATHEFERVANSVYRRPLSGHEQR